MDPTASTANEITFESEGCEAQSENISIQLCEIEMLQSIYTPEELKLDEDCAQMITLSQEADDTSLTHLLQDGARLGFTVRLVIQGVRRFQNYGESISIITRRRNSGLVGSTLALDQITRVRVQFYVPFAGLELQW